MHAAGNHQISMSYVAASRGSIILEALYSSNPDVVSDSRASATLPGSPGLVASSGMSKCAQVRLVCCLNVDGRTTNKKIHTFNICQST